MDHPALERLYQRMERPLFNIALRWTWNEAEAQELVQEAFLRLWSARRRLRMETVDSYLYRTVLNLAQKHARRRETWGRVRAMLTGGEPDPTPDARCDDERVRAAIRALPDDLRATLLLCEYSDLKQREIGEIMGIPTGTVGSRRELAIRRLKEVLGNDVTA